MARSRLSVCRNMSKGVPFLLSCRSRAHEKLSCRIFTLAEREKDRDRVRDRHATVHYQPVTGMLSLICLPCSFTLLNHQVLISLIPSTHLKGWLGLFCRLKVKIFLCLSKLLCCVYFPQFSVCFLVEYAHTCVYACVSVHEGVGKKGWKQIIPWLPWQVPAPSSFHQGNWNMEHIEPFGSHSERTGHSSCLICLITQTCNDSVKLSWGF